MTLDKGLKKLYRQRFDDSDKRARLEVWKSLCKNFLQKRIPQNASILDLGAGQCEFINTIQASKKYAVDLNEYLKDFAGPDVRTWIGPVNSLSFAIEQVDVVFISNVLEHLVSRQEITDTLREAHRVLRPGGRILLIQPNIRFCYTDYWNFFDHEIPLSDRSLAEALKIAGFEVVEVIPQFLPYAMHKALKVPCIGLLVKLYLSIPLAWKILGKQTFIVGVKNE